MSEVISLINEKGGVGKSSSAITIAQILSISGYSILLIDLDPQMNTSKMFGKWQRYGYWLWTAVL